jgi:hypothetical protein
VRTEIKELVWVRATNSNHWITSIVAYDGTKYCGEVYHRDDIDAYVGELHRHADTKNGAACNERHLDLLIRLESPALDFAKHQIASCFAVVIHHRERDVQPEPDRALS